MSGFVFGSLVVLSHQEALEQMLVCSQHLLHLEELSLLVFLVYNLFSMHTFLYIEILSAWIGLQRLGTCLRSSRSFSCSIRSFSRSSFMVFCLVRRCWSRWSTHLAPLEPEESSFFSFGFSGLYLCSLRSFIFEDFSFA